MAAADRVPARGRGVGAAARGLRFLQLQHRSVRRRGAAGEFVEVSGLEVAGTRHSTFDEAVPQEFDVAVPLDELGKLAELGLGGSTPS